MHQRANVVKSKVADPQQKHEINKQVANSLIKNLYRCFVAEGEIQYCIDDYKEKYPYADQPKQ